MCMGFIEIHCHEGNPLSHGGGDNDEDSHNDNEVDGDEACRKRRHIHRSSVAGTTNLPKLF